MTGFGGMMLLFVDLYLLGDFKPFPNGLRATGRVRLVTRPSAVQRFLDWYLCRKYAGICVTSAERAANIQVIGRVF